MGSYTFNIAVSPEDIVNSEVHMQIVPGLVRKHDAKTEFTWYEYVERLPNDMGEYVVGGIAMTCEDGRIHTIELGIDPEVDKIIRNFFGTTLNDLQVSEIQEKVEATTGRPVRWNL